MAKIKPLKKEKVNIGIGKSKGFFKFKGNDGKIYRMTLKEKDFCERYLDFSGNGVEAASAVYECKNARVAASVASEYLTKPNIIAYIDLKLEERGFCDENVKKQHLFTLNQFADLGAKNKAIDMFYKLKGEYAPEKLQVEHEFDNVSDKELAEMEKTLIDFLLKK